MGRIILVFCLLIGFAAQAQYPPGYTGINQRYDWFLGKFRGLHVPIRGADDTAFLSTQWHGAGAILVDTVNHKFYFRSGDAWREAGGGGLGSGVITPPEITSNENNYNPTGLAAATTVRISADAARNITGIDASTFSDGKVLIIHNVGGNNITLSNSSGSSTAENQFLFLDGDVVIRANGSSLLRYDGASERWRSATDNVSITQGYGMAFSTGIFPITTAASIRVDTGALKSEYWARRGNASSSGAFIGHTDSADLFFQINGIRAGWINTSSFGSTAFGFRSGGAMAVSSYNTAIGYRAYELGVGGQNTFVGTYAGGIATGTGGENVGIGFGALGNVTGSRNVAVGSSALIHSISTDQSTAIGNYSMLNNVTGDFNVAVGTSSLRGNAEGASNTAIGAISLTQVTTAIESISVTNGGSGYTTATVVISAPTVTADPNNNSLQATATATINSGAITAITITQPGKGYVSPVTATITGDGTGAVLSVTLTSGENNTGLGSGSGALLRTGKYNTFLGQSSGSQILYSSYNVILGSHTATAYSNSSRNLILSDGEGTIRGRWDSAGRWFIPTMVGGGTNNDSVLVRKSDGQIVSRDPASFTGGGGSGTVTEVTATDANGFNFTVTDGTTTPNITLETTVSNDQLVVANAGDIIGYGSLTFTDADDIATLTVGESGGSRGQIVFQNASNSYTLSAPGSGTNVLELPTNAGTEGQVLTKGSANTSSWEDAGGVSMGYSLFADTLKSGSTVLSITPRYTLFDDFIGSNNATGSWSLIGTTSGGAVGIFNGNPTNGTGTGYMRLRTGTGTTGFAMLSSQGSTTNQLGLVDANKVVRWGVYNVNINDLSDGTDTYTFDAGISLSSVTNNQIVFSYTHSVNSGAWVCTSRTGTTPESTNTAVTVVVDTEYDLEFELYDNQVRFWINGTLVATHTTSIPAAGVALYGTMIRILKSAGSTERDCFIDGYKYRVEHENAVQN